MQFVNQTEFNDHWLRLPLACEKLWQ